MTKNRRIEVIRPNGNVVERSDFDQIFHLCLELLSCEEFTYIVLRVALVNI